MELRHQFDAAADETNRDFSRRLADLRQRLPRHELDSAIGALREWRAATLAALRRDMNLKRHAARNQRRIEARAEPPKDRGGSKRPASYPIPK